MLEKRVYYKDTDAGGVVYYANYLAFLEEARTEYLRSLGISLEEYNKKGILFIVTAVNIHYYSPAFYGDILKIETNISEVKHVSIIFEHKILRKNDEKKIVEAVIKMGCLNNKGRPNVMSKELREAIKNGLNLME